MQTSRWSSQSNWVFNLLPSTNINRGSTKSELDTALGSFQIASYSQSQPGVSAIVGRQGLVRYHHTPLALTNMTWGITSRVYEELEASTFTGFLGVSHRRKLGRNTWTFGPSLSRTQTQYDATADKLTWLVKLDHQVSAFDTVSLSVGENHSEFSGAPYLNGVEQTYKVGLTRTTRDNRALRLEMLTTVARPQASHQQYDAFALGTNYAWLPSPKWKLNIGSTMGARSFFGPYPLHFQARYDEFFDLSFKMNHASWKVFGSHPTIGCQYTINQSNIALYDFNAFDCNFTLSL